MKRAVISIVSCLAIPVIARADANSEVRGPVEELLKFFSSDIRNYLDGNNVGKAMNGGDKPIPLFLQKSRICLDAAAKYPDAKVTVKTSSMEPIELSMEDARKICEAVAVAATAKEFAVPIEKVEQDLFYAALWAVKMRTEKMSDGMLGIAADGAKRCNSAVDALVAANMPGDRMLDINQDRAYRLDEIKPKVCAALESLTNKQIADEKAEEEKKFGPFWKVLSGDKRIVFDKLRNMKVYGPGGKLLSTPAQFRATDVWFTVGVNRDGVQPRWNTDRYAFKGMKAVGVVGGSSGNGDTPPSAAFR